MTALPHPLLRPERRIGAETTRMLVARKSPTWYLSLAPLEMMALPSP